VLKLISKAIRRENKLWHEKIVGIQKKCKNKNGMALKNAKTCEKVKMD